MITAIVRTLMAWFLGTNADLPNDHQTASATKVVSRKITNQMKVQLVGMNARRMSMRAKHTERRNMVFHNSAPATRCYFRQREGNI